MKPLSHLGPRRAMAIAAGVAALVYGGALLNGWALDDAGIIESNPAAHTLSAALQGFFSTYWPPEQGAAGLYRPFVILTYALDWSLSGGNAAWFHTVNVLLHAVACAMVVAVALAWLRPPWALTAAVIFAVHPVHVEAVANVVGRAEVLAAVSLFGAVLSARRYRRAAGRARAGWGAATMLAVLIGLLTKEHGVVAIAVLAVDEWLEARPAFRRSVPLYVGVAAITVAWFAVWYGIAGAWVEWAGGAGVNRLGFADRITTMLPAQLDVLRLLTWPMDLSSDYSPLVIPQRLEWSGLALLGLVIGLAVLALGFLSARRAPAVAFGILAAACAYAPTSNVLFTSGITLGERNLYIAVLAPALALGWLASHAEARRRVTLGAIVVLAGLYVVRTATRVPVWRDSLSIVIADLGAHPENYRAHVRLASVFMRSGDAARSVAELALAGRLFPGDPYVALGSVPRARAVGLTALALAEARRAYDLRSDDPRISHLYVQSLVDDGRLGEAFAIAREAVAVQRADTLVVDTYLGLLEVAGAPHWTLESARAERARRAGGLVAAFAGVDRAVRGLAGRDVDPRWCWDVRLLESVTSTFRQRTVTVTPSTCSGFHG